MPKKKKITKKIIPNFKIDLFYLSLFSFLYIATFTFSTLSWSEKNSNIPTKPSISGVLASEEILTTTIPVLISSTTFPVLSAQSVLATDLDSGEVLYEKDPDLPSLPASTTKIMTALVSLDYYPMDKIVKVDGLIIDGQKMGLVGGEEIAIDDLLYGLLVYSANDAAEVLAENYPGGRDFFITAMNLKAKELGLADTFYTNPSGLDDFNQRTTAYDLIRISNVAMQDPLFSKIVSTKEKTVTSIDGKIKHKLVNINKLLGNVDGVLGVKTGWTENARENLVTYVKRGERDLMIALLGSQDRFGETKRLIDWILESYEWREVQDNANRLTEVARQQR